jgi:hypothetical protein
MGSGEIRGWTSLHRQTEDGAVESEQHVLLDRAVVDFTERGAEVLGRSYWDEVRRSTFGIVRVRRHGRALDLRAFGRGPRLLSFGTPVLEVTPTRVGCRFPISGGLLAHKPAGEISFVQSGGEALQLASAIHGFFPTLAARAGGPTWTGALYNLVQTRIHVAICRRYFARLIASAAG